jgi:uncharacterized protein (DUF1800 family)
MIDREQHRAASHFGLGVSERDLHAIGKDPGRWLLRQIEPGVASGQPSVPASHLAIVAQTQALAERRQAQQRRDSDSDRADERAGADLVDMQLDYRRQLQRTIATQTLARVQHAGSTEAPFRERLVHFWSNHFTVSRQGRPQIVGACQAYENEAIRAQLDGRFEDMLLAVASHPVMLFYLDNVQSMGPASLVGRRRGMGQNENLAREIMELHTLGVDGGYTQTDVKALATMLTGWTVGNPRLRRFGAEAGKFAFVPVMHQPGAVRFLGHDYGDGGVEQAQRALKHLARHPSTARFLATKLARHFVADEPPAEVVEALTETYLETDGHLPSLHRAIVAQEPAWDPTNRKLKTPFETIVSAHRGLDLAVDRPQLVLAPLRLMNHFPFTASSPAGWPDRQDHWGAPTALKQRIEWAVAFAGRTASAVDVRAVAERLVPPGAGTLATSVGRAESATQGLALLLASPDFQWR